MTDRPLTLADFVSAARMEIAEIDGARLETMRNERPGLLVVDVREAGEHERGCLKGALLVPRDILESAADLKYSRRIQALVDARERPVVLYCATGGRSAMAAATLKLMGFREVYSLAGGIAQWQTEQRPVVGDAGPVDR